jgi:hypothetical protein
MGIAATAKAKPTPWLTLLATSSFRLWVGLPKTIAPVEIQESYTTKEQRATPETGMARHCTVQKSMLRNLYHVLSRGALGALDDIELDLGTFLQRPETFRLYGRMVDEAITASVLGGQKAEALLIIEPLNSSLGTHQRAPFVFRWPACG